MDEVICTRTESNLYKFIPTTCAWQLNTSTKLNLPVQQVSISHIANSGGNYIAHPMEIRTTQPDGNCYFRAIAFILTGTENHHLHVRHSVVNHMQTISSLMSPLMERNMDVINYLQRSRMSEISVWATSTEIYATAHLLKTYIYVYGKWGNKLAWQKHTGQYL